LTTYTLYLTWLAFKLELCGPSWSRLLCIDRPTFLVGPDGLTWLLCVGWQIYCPGWSWWSDLTALYGLTDPLSWLVLMVWLDCSVWADRSTAQSTVLVGPDDGLTWLLSMDSQIHCSGWCWWSDLIALYGLVVDIFCCTWLLRTVTL